jgi:hypothetical protein
MPRLANRSNRSLVRERDFSGVDQLLKLVSRHFSRGRHIRNKIEKWLSFRRTCNPISLRDGILGKLVRVHEMCV